MSQYLNLFKTKAEADAYIYTENNTPSVSYCEEDESVKYTKKIDPYNGYEYVDLGLPSGLKWAKCNVGAEEETDHGKYFQWGDVEGRTADEIANKLCSWSTAPFNNGSIEFDEFYFFDNSKWLDGDVLKPEYDSASVNMGGNWKMPTEAQFNELLNGTTNTWVTDYNGSGINGRLFTSKTNGNTLFIPVTGLCDNRFRQFVNSLGCLFSSSLNSSNHNSSISLVFHSNYCTISTNNRYYGLPVRGVCE